MRARPSRPRTCTAGVHAPHPLGARFRPSLFAALTTAAAAAVLSSSGGIGPAAVIVSATSLHEAVFPPNDEYDPYVFDPLSAFGAPYGGYARAARSRLAKLPLRLVGGAEFESMPQQQDEQQTPSPGGEADEEKEGKGDSGADAAAAASSSTPSAPHFRMSDSDGRQFVCRVYNEEELDPHSVVGSMFDAPQKRAAPLVSADAEGGSDQQKGVGEEDEEDNDDDDEYEYYDEDEYYHDHDGDGREDPSAERDREQRQQQQVVYADPQGEFKIMGDAGSAKAAAALGAALDRHRQGQAAEENGRGGVGGGGHPPHQPVTVHPQDISRQLAKLEGVCAQIHPGWWSYEWCHEKQVSQFHVAVVAEERQQTAAAKRFEIQDVTKVGTFSRRVVRVDDGRGGNPHKLPGAKSDDGHPLLSGSVVVTDTFIDGDWCEEFGIHRSVDVEIRCCHGPNGKPLGSGGARRGGDPNNDDGKAGFAALKYVKEHPVEKCTYRAQVCTPLLCADAFTSDESSEGGSGSGSGKQESTAGKNAQQSTPDAVKKKKKNRKKKKKNESIRDILDRALGNHCLQRNAGWWTYEFCHTRHAREFHGTNVLDANTGVSRQIVEEAHILGLYDPDVHESYPDSEEVDHVVNATDSSDIGGGGSRSSGEVKSISGVEGKGGSIKLKMGRAPPEAGGNGAVFVQEYTHGLVCDHSDVADSVIKGGNIVGGGIERSTTVRFSCGKNYELVKVNEDSTCHYIFDVTVPALCGHSLFKATVVKTQVVKCLPVDFALD